MNTQTKTTARVTTSNTPIAVAMFKGTGGKARQTALLRLPVDAYNAETGKAAMLASAAIALGKTPTDTEVKAVRRGITIGIAACRMPAGELPKGCKSQDQRMAVVMDLFDNKAAPAEPGKQAKSIGRKTGRRSSVQHRIIRNAEDRASKYLAELAPAPAPGTAPKAQTEAQKNAAKRKVGGAVNPPTLGLSAAAQLVASDSVTVAMTSDIYVNHMQTQLAALVQFDNKHAAKRPTTHGAFIEALRALKQLANKSANEYEENKARIAAKQAAK